MINLYKENEKLFNNNGIKILKPLKAVIRKEDNGSYYLSIKDTIDNIEFYQEGLIVRTDTPWGKQGFRLNNIEIDNNMIDVKSNHLYFDTKRYVIADSYIVDKNLNDALDYLNQNCDSTTPFSTISDIDTRNSFRCVRKTLEEAINVLIERWGGHLIRDNFKIEIRKNIGEDRGVTLAYLKNITKITAKENWDDVITKILPVGKDGILLPEKFIELEEMLYDSPYTKIISFSQDEIQSDNYISEKLYKEALVNDLRKQATKYLQDNKVPKVNYSLSAYLKDVSDIGDIIRVKHPKCKIDLTTNVIAIEYDCILDKYIKIEFGNFNNKLKDLINNVQNKVTSEIKKETNEKIDFLSSSLKQATSEINNSFGKSNVIYENRNELIIVDKLPKEEAVNVIKINANGIGFGQHGINGNFNSAWRIDGTLDMQQINVINLVADMIKGGTLKLGSNLNQSGILELYDESNKLISKFDKNGLEMYCLNGDTIKINPEVGFAGYNNQGQKVYWVDGEEFHQKKSFIEAEITLAYKIRFIPIETENNNGVAVVALYNGG